MMKHRLIAIVSAVCVVASLSLTVQTKVSASSSSLNSDALSDFTDQVLVLVNRERAEYGLSPLYTTSALKKAAGTRAEECLTLFDHTRPNGSECFTVYSQYGLSYAYAGENLAIGQRTPADVFASWMNSEGHRANILSSNYSYVGIGLADDGYYVWTEDFIGGVTLSGASLPTKQNVKGDGNYDAAVDAVDAHLALVADANYNLTGSYKLNSTQTKLLDVDGSGVVDTVDAHDILLYATQKALGKSPTWSSIIG